jgi:predicted double-glycine peptidase
MGRFARARAVVGLCVWLGVAVGVGSGESRASTGSPLDGEAEQSVIGYVRPGLAAPALANMWNEFGFPEGLKPMLALRWEGIVRQRVDAGCGPASLATLYTHYLDLPVTEDAMARAVTAEALRRGRGRSDIQSRGYTLADLKRVADRQRMVTAAFRSTPEELVNLKIPVVTHVNIRGYGHFVVLRGLVGDRVVVADPNFGNLTLPIGQFRELWSGVMLAVARPKDPIQKTEFDPRGGPVSREIDYSTFRRGPALPAAGMRPPTFIGIAARSTFGQVVLSGLEEFHPFSLERSAIQLNVD